MKNVLTVGIGSGEELLHLTMSTIYRKTWKERSQRSNRSPEHEKLGVSVWRLPIRKMCDDFGSNVARGAWTHLIP